jgi:DNA-binding LacI/PurR family transcriptional regulator
MTATARPRVTIAQIAQEAGVSEATVSKVLNGRPEVAQHTRARVQDLLAARNYQRRTLPAASNARLELVISDLGTPWAAEVVSGAEQEARRAGVTLAVTATRGDREETRRCLEEIAERQADGVILVLSPLEPDSLERLTLHGTPMVVVDPVGGAVDPAGGDPTVSTVGATNWAGGLAATEHLIDLGHRRIGIITGPETQSCSQQRLDGYRAALARAGIAFDESLVRRGNFRADGGERETAALLELDEPPTAIFAGSDLQASGVYAEARRRRLGIPDELSVVGFDDVALTEWMSPKMTTVRQPLREMARLATRTVLDSAGDDAHSPIRIELATSLVVRESTASVDIAG